MKMTKKEIIMSVLLIVLILIFIFVVLLVVSNKENNLVTEIPNSEFDVSNYVIVSDVDTSNYIDVYKSAVLKKVKFKNISDILVNDFYTNQDVILEKINDNLIVNKENIEKYNKDNNINNYTLNSKLETLLLYEIKDNILSLMYLVEDTVDYRGIDSYINNIFIDVSNNSLISNEAFLNKYNVDRSNVVSEIFTLLLNEHTDKFVDKDTDTSLSKEEVQSKKNEYINVLSENFNEYFYPYVYQENIYLKYNKSNLYRLLFNEELDNTKYSTYKISI